MLYLDEVPHVGGVVRAHGGRSTGRHRDDPSEVWVEVYYLLEAIGP